MTLANDIDIGWRLPGDAPLSFPATPCIAGASASPPWTRTAYSVRWVALLASAMVSRAAPDWVSEREHGPDADAWMEIWMEVGGGVAALPLHRVGEGAAEIWTASTVITRAALEELAAEMVGTGIRIVTIGPRTEADRTAESARNARRQQLRDETHYVH